MAGGNHAEQIAWNRPPRRARIGTQRSASVLQPSAWAGGCEHPQEEEDGSKSAFAGAVLLFTLAWREAWVRSFLYDSTVPPLVCARLP